MKFAITLLLALTLAPLAVFAEAIPSIWCTHPTAVRFDADVTGDGKIDAVCVDRQTGHKWVAIRRGGVLTQSWEDPDSRWCTHAGTELFVGDQNGDKRADLVCRDRSRPGRQWVDYADQRGRFEGTDQEGTLPDFTVVDIRQHSGGYLLVNVRNEGDRGIVTRTECSTLGRAASNNERVEILQGESATIRVSIRPNSGRRANCGVRGVSIDGTPEIFISNNSLNIVPRTR